MITTGAVRLLGAPATTLQEHLDRVGAMPAVTGHLVGDVEASGLTGRGGAGFPTGRKMAAVSGPRAVVVGNGAEGEPLSRKDFALLSRAPHLVLDGLAAAAEAIGAEAAHLYVHADATVPIRDALAERRAARLDRLRVDVVEAPGTFVAGEESAALRRIEGGPPLPRDRTATTAAAGLRGRPTLVNNVETLADIALIARYGPEWFRTVGDPDDPGTMLVTLSGTRIAPTVVEVPTGIPFAALLDLAGTGAAEVRAVLVGGYHGSWLGRQHLDAARLSRPALRQWGASTGAGVIHILDRSECGLRRTAEITGYLAGQSARQCGPCLNGLPRLAALVDELAHGRPTETVLQELRRILGLVDGRGSCRHPDGTVRMVRSALDTFADEIVVHGRRACTFRQR